MKPDLTAPGGHQKLIHTPRMSPDTALVQDGRHVTNPAGSPEYLLFIGSPGDVDEERRAVLESAANVENENPFGYRLRVVRWEDLVAPDYGRAQTIVFEATRFDSIHMFLGIFWSRLGTPPGARSRAPSRARRPSSWARRR